MSRTKLMVRAIVGVAALSALLVVAPSAGAAASRSYVGQIDGEFERPAAAFVTPNDDVWIADIQSTLISHFGPYPANEELGVQASKGRWGGALEPHTFGVSQANGFLYTSIAGEGGGCALAEHGVIFDNYGEVYKDIPHFCNSMMTVNNAPDSEAYGNYFEYGSGGIISMYDGYSNPVNFTGTASYISGNELTGTPSGPLGGGNGAQEWGGFAIDREGNIWVDNSKGNPRVRRQWDLHPANHRKKRRWSPCQQPESHRSKGIRGLPGYRGNGGGSDQRPRSRCRPGGLSDPGIFRAGEVPRPGRRFRHPCRRVRLHLLRTVLEILLLLRVRDRRRLKRLPLRHRRPQSRRRCVWARRDRAQGHRRTRHQSHRDRRHCQRDDRSQRRRADHLVQGRIRHPA